MTVNTVNLENHQPQTPLGLLLAPLVSQGHPPQESHYTILIGWTRPYNKLGIVQKSGQIRIGDRLVEINGVSVRNWTFEKIIRVLRCFDDGVRIRSLGFEVLKDEGGIENRTFVWSVARRRLYSLNTSIRSVVVLPLEDNPNEQEDTNHNDNNNNNGNNNNSKRRMVAKYEIRCDLVIRHYHGNDEVIQYSVWKRFSDFQKLHQTLMEKFSYKSHSRSSSSRRRRNNNNTTTSAAAAAAVTTATRTTTTRTTAITDGIAFPSNRVLQSILYGTSSEWFLEQRKRELQDYWTCLQSHHPEFFEFGDPANHRYCQETALFLEIEQYLHPSTKKLGHLEKQKHKQKQKQKQTQQESSLSLSSLPLPSPLHFELELDTSAISEIPMGTSTASISSDLRKLVVVAVDEGNVDQSNLSGNGSGSFDGNNGGEETMSTSIQASTSNSMKAIRQRDKKQIIVTKDNLNNSKKKKKKKKKIASAKPAFQRKLLEE